eukprot:2962386-Rhodomonas_salina.1
MGGYTSCYNLEPTDPTTLLERQGTSVLAVLSRCRGNYVNRQWDEGAALLFNYSLVDSLRSFRGAILTAFPAVDTVDTDLAKCMRATLAAGQGNDA